jgi:hypothetical protein
MNGNCLDIGTIQSFLDCELDHTRSAEVSGHIAACDACALLLSEAEEESSLVFSALEREMDTLVPTQRLWTRINDSIEVEKRSRPFWHKARAFVSLALVNPSFAAAAGILIVAGLFAIYWSGRSVPTQEIAENKPVTVSQPPVHVVEPQKSVPMVSEPIKTEKPAAPAATERAVYRAERPRPIAPSPSPAIHTTDAVVATNVAYVPGEESYLKTISSLSKIVDTKKDTSMRPSQRVAYERDMAVVDDTISKMKKEVKKDPRNESARQVLYASYQNKIDLLNSVSKREELMASIR